MWLALVACSQPRSEACKAVCVKEADCVRQTSAPVPFDEKECIAACSVLEADPDNKARVVKHADCVMKANQSCPAVLDCE
jgi:hypothetical protein